MEVDDLLKDFELRETKDIEQHGPLEREECYLISEVLEKYEVKYSTLYQVLLNAKVARERCGKGMMVPKVMVDKLLKDYNIRRQATKISEVLPDITLCCTVKEAIAKFGLPDVVTRVRLDISKLQIQTSLAA